MQQQGQWGAPQAQWGQQQPQGYPPAPPPPPPKKRTSLLAIGCLVLACPLSCGLLAVVGELGGEGRLAAGEQGATANAAVEPAAAAAPPEAAPQLPALPPASPEETAAAIEQMRTAATTARAALRAMDVAGARSHLASVRELVERFQRVQPKSAELEGALAELTEIAEVTDDVAQLPTAAAEVTQRVNEADSIASTDPERADELYRLALSTIAELDELPAEMRRALTYPRRSDVQKKQRRIARAAAEARANRPVAIEQLQEMQLRYADLRGGPPVQISGSVRPDTYYNCRYRSQSQYRSFVFSQGLFSPRMNIYCARGSAGCESLYERAIRGGSVDVNATLRYPRSNSVCEESQAGLESYSVR